MSTFYVWETGPKSWNKLEVLVASDNSSVKFDPPMNVKYTHSGTSSNSGKSYDNSSFYLEYGGFGNLWGLPSFCINRKDGEKVSCADDDSTRYVEDIMVPAYADVTQTKDGSTNYIVKPLEIEQTMKKASSASVCTDAGAGTDTGLAFGDISLPDASGYTAPEMDCNAKCRRSSSCRGRGKNVILEVFQIMLKYSQETLVTIKIHPGASVILL